MGGGDLNLKKSWHPQTLRNVEKVWKAEQRHEAEQKKIEELQRELRDERAREEMQRYAEDTGAVKKREEKLDWMYQGAGSMVSREEYLLGRPVDKFVFEKMQDPESGPSQDTGLLPGSIFSSASSSAASSALDMSNKIREDPLFMIRKREDEMKREVLKNPVKMKKIRELLQSSLEETGKRRRKKKRKEKRRGSSSEKEKRRGSSSEEEERRRRKSHSPPPRHKLAGYGLQMRENAAERARGPHTSKPRRSPSPKRAEPYRRPRDPGYTKRMSGEELERRRAEMMQDAKQREADRQSAVTRYKMEDQREEKEAAARKKGGRFIHDMKLQSAASSSLEDRVKRNIHGIQRTAAELEKNFMRR